MNEEKLTHEEELKQSQETLRKKLEKLQLIKTRVAAAKQAQNKNRLKIAQLDYQICMLDIEKYKKKIEKEKIIIDNEK